MNELVLSEPDFEFALFSGAGGGVLGGELDGRRCVGAVEFAKYPRRVLLARQRDGLLPWFPVWDDVRTFRSDNPACAEYIGWLRSIRHRLVISGGFPCQDISVAGKGDGLDGERSGLWTEMARIIGEVQPRFAFVENSPMLTSRGLDRVLGDLSTLGFDAEWGVVGADDAGAPHKRERIWILAYSAVERLEGAEPIQPEQQQRTRARGIRREHPIGQLADPNVCGRLHRQAQEQPAERRIHAQRQPEPSGEDVAHAVSQRDADNGSGSIDLAPGESEGQGEQRERLRIEPRERDDNGRGEWWAVEPAVGRVANGVADRVDRLKAIGNGQVPAAASMAWNILYQRIQQR